MYSVLRNVEQISLIRLFKTNAHVICVTHQKSYTMLSLATFVNAINALVCASVSHLKVDTLAFVRNNEEWINGTLWTTGLLTGGGGKERTKSTGDTW